MPSVCDGQYDEQAIVYRTRAILGRKGLRLNKLTGRQAEAKAKYGYGPYVIIGGTYGDKIVAEGMAIEGLESAAEGLPADRYVLPTSDRPRTPDPAPSASAPEAPPAPAPDVTWQERRIAELEQAVKERDAMIRILRDRLVGR